MRTIRLYHPENLSCGETTFLQAETSNHLIRVLRTKVDTPVTLFNGDGFDYHCVTLDTNSKKTQLSIKTKESVKNESNINITLIQGLSQHDRMETTIQKSVELGVNRIIPVICHRSNIKSNKERLSKKLDYWKKVAISACEQSGRCVIPEITDVTLINDLHNLLDDNTLKIALNPDTHTSIRDVGDNNHINIIIGPEGGLNDEEITLLENNGFISAKFGPRVLRTETAGPAVISALQTLWGDI